LNSLRILLPALAVMALPGCAVLINPTSIASAVIDGISYAATGKGSTDHVISEITDRDCALHRGLMDKPVCQPATGERLLTENMRPSEHGQAVAGSVISELAKPSKNIRR